MYFYHIVELEEMRREIIFPHSFATDFSLQRMETDKKNILIIVY